MIWRIPKMWQGGECWIIGGGPSVPRVFDVPDDVIQSVIRREQPMSVLSPYFAAIHDRHVIGVNAAFLLGDWIDVVLFGDSGFYRKNRREMLNFKKVKVTCNPRTEGDKYCDLERVKYVPRDRQHNEGITTKPNHVSWNKNTGAAAINLAYHLGCKRIMLLGFDMSITGNERHWHSHYRGMEEKVNEKALPFARHLKGFPRIAKDAKRLGVEILNVSPNSVIKDFKKVTLKEVL